MKIRRVRIEAPDIKQVLEENQHSKVWQLEKIEELPANHQDRVEFGFTHAATFKSGAWEIRRHDETNALIASGTGAAAIYFYHPDPERGWELGAN